MNLLRRLILKLPEIELIQVEEGLYSPRLLDLELELSTIDGGMTPPPHQSIRERERERGAVSIDLVVEARQPIHQGGLGNLSWRVSNCHPSDLRYPLPPHTRSLRGVFVSFTRWTRPRLLDSRRLSRKIDSS